MFPFVIGGASRKTASAFCRSTNGPDAHVIHFARAVSLKIGLQLTIELSPQILPRHVLLASDANLERWLAVTKRGKGAPVRNLAITRRWSPRSLTWPTPIRRTP
jgi:hypothetical protein